FASRTLLPAEKNYSITDLEGLAVSWAVSHFHYYLYGRKFNIVTDHSALVQLFTKDIPRGRVGRWALKLRNYDFEIIHKDGSKNPADFLSRYPAEIGESEVLNIDQWDNRTSYKSLYDATRKEYNGESEVERACSKFYEKEGELYFTNSKEGKLYPRPERIAAMCSEYNNASHVNVEDTLREMRKYLYVPNVRSIVEDIVKSCESCQRNNYGKRRAEPFNIFTPKKPFQVWGMDVAGPLPVTDSGNKYILIGVDYFTKWPVAVAVSSIEGYALDQFLIDEIVSNYGIPEKIVTDRGTHFTNDHFFPLNRLLKIEHRPVTAYRPQGNGQIERMVQEIKQKLKKHIYPESKNWDSYLWQSLLSIRTSTNRSIGKSPAEVVYGLQLMNPARWAPEELEDPTTLEQDRMRLLSDVRKQAYEKNGISKRIEKIRYDGKVRQRQLKVGDQVLRYTDGKNFTFGETATGPYKVTRVLKHGSYEIIDHKGYADIVHIDKIKVYYPRERAIPTVATGSSRSTLASKRLIR
ncbi:Transposon Ty3-I Gag-Pol polyprotein, partial [Smittium culicis]